MLAISSNLVPQLLHIPQHARFPSSASSSSMTKFHAKSRSCFYRRCRRRTVDIAAPPSQRYVAEYAPMLLPCSLFFPYIFFIQEILPWQRLPLPSIRSGKQRPYFVYSFIICSCCALLNASAPSVVGSFVNKIGNSVQSFLAGMPKLLLSHSTCNYNN